MDKKKFSTYWANTSSNSLVGKLIREGDKETKIIMEDLLKGRALHTEIDEQIVFNQLASGYLRVEKFAFDREWGREEYDLVLTNQEVRFMFQRMIRGWFAKDTAQYNGFVKALLQDNRKEMNIYMNKVALAQIEEKRYAAALEAKGIAPERIRKYGFAFEGKKVLIG